MSYNIVCTTTTTTTTSPFWLKAQPGCVALLCVAFCVESRLLTSVEDGGAGTSAAKRRRQRRLRSWWRHECQSVRMALNAAAHHSAEKVAAGEKNSGLRAQTSFSAGRPGVLKDPAPQEQSRSVTWLPRGRCWPCRCWPARQVRRSTLAPSTSSSRGRLPRRRRRTWRRRRGRNRLWRRGGGRRLSWTTQPLFQRG